MLLNSCSDVISNILYMLIAHKKIEYRKSFMSVSLYVSARQQTFEQIYSIVKMNAFGKKSITSNDLYSVGQTIPNIKKHELLK